MVGDKEGADSEKNTSSGELKALEADHANLTSGDTANQEGRPQRPERSSNSNKRPSFSFLQKLTLSEWLTFFVGSGTLVIAFLTWRTAADTSQMEKAVRGLTSLATQTKRQADAVSDQVNAVGSQENIMAGEFVEMRAQTRDLNAQARAAHGQLAESKSQTNLIQANQRPWLKVVPSVYDGLTGGIFWIDGDLYAAFDNTVTNVGHLPAFHVIVRTSAYIGKKGDFIKYERKVCNNMEVNKQEPAVGAVVYPGETNSRTGGDGLKAGIFITARQVQEYGLRDAEGQKSVSIKIVGCVNYTFENGLSHHHTGYFYMLARRVHRRGLPDAGSYSFPVGMDIPSADIILIKGPYGTLNTD